MKLERVEEWMQGRAPFPALMSAWLATSAEFFYRHMTCMVHHRKYAMLFNAGQIEEWSRQYRSFLDGLTPENAAQMLPGLLIVQVLPSMLPWFEKMRSLEDLNQPFITDFVRTYLLEDFNVVEDESSDEERLRMLAPIFDHPATVFAFKILIPSVIYYQSTPAMLVSRALKGNLYAFACLLRLDSNLVAVPEFHAIWEPLSRDPQNAAFKRLKAALNNPPYKSLKSKRMKIRIKVAVAVAIEQLFKIMGQPISRSDIRDLYDRYAQDTKQGIIDEDLPETENGFDEAIRREIKAWKTAAMVQT
jgi:hypothetical protein